MNNVGETRLHPLLASRWSPASFDPAHEIADAEVEAVLEAARWSPSAGNSQPWAFIVARRGDETHGRLVPHLAGSSARWAPSASLLVVNIAHRFVEETDWDYSEFSVYDLGQAVAHMTIQAESMGLAVRQFRAFDREAIEAEFEIPAHWEATTMAAYGLPAGASSPRDRRATQDLLWPLSPEAQRRRR